MYDFIYIMGLKKITLKQANILLEINTIFYTRGRKEGRKEGREGGREGGSTKKEKERK